MQFNPQIFFNAPLDYFALPENLPRHISFRMQRTIDDLVKEMKDEKFANPNRCTVVARKMQFIFEQVVLGIYRNLNIEVGSHEIVVSGFVASDGLGDYYHIKAAAELLHLKFPGKIGMVIELPGYRTRLRQLTLPVEKNFDLVVFDEKDTEIDEVARAIEMLQRAQVVVDLPYDVPCSLIPKISAEQKTVKLFEYGSESASLSKSPKSRSLGLDQYELGIVIKPKLLETSLQDLRDIALRQFFFLETADMHDQEIAYHNETDFAFAYMKHDFFTRSLAGFVFSCCEAYAFSEKQAIDIVCPHDGNGLLESLFKESNIGIKTVQFYRKKGLEVLLEKEITLEKKGKLLRLINPFPLSNHDMQIFMNKSLYVGCTGDMTPSEAISLGRVLFYDLLDHKRAFYRSMVNCAEEFFKEEADCFVRYLKICEKFRTAEMNRTNEFFSLVQECGKLMRHPKTIEQSGRFCELLKTHFCFNEVLADIVSRQLVHARVPELKEMEKELMESFLKGEKNLRKSYVELAGKVQGEAFFRVFI